MFDGQPKATIIYQTATGTRPFAEWVAALRDREAQARIEKRLIRLRGGNPGDYKAVGTAFMSCGLITGRAIAFISPSPGSRLFSRTPG